MSGYIHAKFVEHQKQQMQIKVKTCAMLNIKNIGGKGYLKVFIFHIHPA